MFGELRHLISSDEYRAPNQSKSHIVSLNKTRHLQSPSVPKGSVERLHLWHFIKAGTQALRARGHLRQEVLATCWPSSNARHRKQSKHLVRSPPCEVPKWSVSLCFLFKKLASKGHSSWFCVCFERAREPTCKERAEKKQQQRGIRVSHALQNQKSKKLKPLEATPLSEPGPSLRHSLRSMCGFNSAKCTLGGAWQAAE